MRNVVIKDVLSVFAVWRNCYRAMRHICFGDCIVTVQSPIKSSAEFYMRNIIRRCAEEDVYPIYESNDYTVFDNGAVLQTVEP